MGNVSQWAKFKDKCDETQRTLSAWLKSQNLPFPQEVSVLTINIILLILSAFSFPLDPMSKYSSMIYALKS
jgi:hypothetical protein